MYQVHQYFIEYKNKYNILFYILKGKGKRGRKRERENVESDSNDDSESQSIDINATTIDNNASDDVASRTRSKMTIKARNERARLDKAQKRSQNIPSRSLTSEDGSIEY